MEKANKVSVWLGNFDSKREFGNYMEEQFDEEGDMTSVFMSDFAIEFIDSQFQEVLYDDNLKKENLMSASYSESFLDCITADFSKYNCIVLLYDFNYHGTAQNTDKMIFVGVYDYSN